MTLSLDAVSWRVVPNLSFLTVAVQNVPTLGACISNAKRAPVPYIRSTQLSGV